MGVAEELRTLAGAWDEWGLGGKLTELAERLERQEVVSDEDAEAAKWVREHGGLEEVARATRDADNRRGELCSMLGVDTTTGWSDAVAELDRRLMPPGMEWLLTVWPKWSNGEYCKFGDLWVAPTYGENGPKPLRRLAIFSPEQLKEWGQEEGDDFGYEWGFIRPSDTSYRPHKVEATHVCADRLPIEKDETVYLIDGNGTPLTVVETPIEGCYQPVVVRLPNGVKTAFDPTRLTHAKPEQEPLCRACKYWHKDPTANRMGVCWFYYHEVDGEDSYRACVGDCEACEEFLARSNHELPDSRQSEPEPPDSAERIADDIRKMAEEWCSHPSLREASEKAASSVGEATMGVALGNLSKRCRALAERERGDR